MNDFKAGKSYRVLFIYNMLLSGKHLDKSWLANEFGVNERTIQRDLDDIRSFVDNDGILRGDIRRVIYDRKEKTFYLISFFNISQ